MRDQIKGKLPLEILSYIIKIRFKVKSVQEGKETCLNKIFFEVVVNNWIENTKYTNFIKHNSNWSLKKQIKLDSADYKIVYKIISERETTGISKKQ